MSNVSLRILTALVGAPLVVGLAYVGGWAFGGFILLIALGAQYECYRLFEGSGSRPFLGAGLLMGALVVLQPLWGDSFAVALGVGLLVVASIPFAAPGRAPWSDFGVTLLGVFYPAYLLSFVLVIRLGNGPDVFDREAFFLTVLFLLLVWASDTFAYIVGRAFGRTPLAPVVSPHKTWEGALGGGAGALLVAAFVPLTPLAFLGWGHALALAVVCSVTSLLGDLAESRLKRYAGAKDSGILLPGHGGLLDRIDGLVLAAPFYYLYLVHVAGALAA